MAKFIVTLESTATVSKTITADSINHAMELAQILADEDKTLKANKGFSFERESGSKVIGVCEE